MRNLAIDIGNSRIKTGVFENETLVEVQHWSRPEEMKIAEWITNQKWENVIYSTVAEPLPTAVSAVIPEELKLLELTASTPLPIQNRYGTPETLGKDRLAAVLGAFSQFPNTNCLVIDSGTCVTYDLLTASGDYLGGNISPGWEMRLDAMAHFTARLPRPESQILMDWIGNTTENALQNGAFYGLIAEMEGLIQRASSQFGTINVILTGGNAQNFAKKLKSKIFVNQNLVLEGLNKILIYNVASS